MMVESNEALRFRIDIRQDGRHFPYVIFKHITLLDDGDHEIFIPILQAADNPLSLVTIFLSTINATSETRRRGVDTKLVT